MPHSSFNSDIRATIMCCMSGALIGFATPASARKKPNEDFVATTAPQPSAAPNNGAIFQYGSYAALTSGMRASQIGDILTIVLAERTSASKSNAANTDRTGDIGLTPPTTGPLSAISPSDVNMSGKQSFKGKGNAAQSNALTGEITVTIAALYPNGTMLVRGEKLLTLNRGDERVQLSGIVRSADISTDNRVLSSRIANAHILYTGKGEVARASQQGWLQRFFSRISPF
jgi:flagellar L-ring protein FlgH